MNFFFYTLITSVCLWGEMSYFEWMNHTFEVEIISTYFLLHHIYIMFVFKSKNILWKLLNISILFISNKFIDILFYTFQYNFVFLHIIFVLLWFYRQLRGNQQCSNLYQYPENFRRNCHIKISLNLLQNKVQSNEWL